MSITISEPLDPRVKQKIKHFVEQLLTEMPIEVVILFGSLAKHQEGWGSDIDLLIIGGHADQDWFTRQSRVYTLSGGGFDIFVYTRQEIQEMLQNYHLIILEALADGIILYDPQKLGLELKNQVQKWEKEGHLVRLINGWQIIE
ncbi:MAG: nucleotidyltransferase domain-containing protein [Candidatus Ranarchaeia archaeon]